MRSVIALGGNALLRRGEPMTAEVQRNNVKVAAKEQHGEDMPEVAGWRRGRAGRAMRRQVLPHYGPGLRLRWGDGLSYREFPDLDRPLVMPSR